MKSVVRSVFYSTPTADVGGQPPEQERSRKRGTQQVRSQGLDAAPAELPEDAELPELLWKQVRGNLARQRPSIEERDKPVSLGIGCASIRLTREINRPGNQGLWRARRPA